MNADDIQGLGQSVKFLGMMWFGKIKVIPEIVTDKYTDLTVTDKTHTSPILKMVKRIQAFFDLLGYWRPFISHLVQKLRSLYALVKKGRQ